jgi:putative tryptophan/tyrosine transport system substrate-binding protein
MLTFGGAVAASTVVTRDGSAVGLIGRRHFLITACGLLVASVAEAQKPATIPRIGVLTLNLSREDTEPFRQGLRELGYAEGKNISIEWRAARSASGYAKDAAELVYLKVDVIVAASNGAVAAALKATKRTPIVMVYPTDPVGDGFVTNLARPGGNVTGLSSQSTELQGKRLQLLKEIVPNLSQVGVLWDPTEPERQAQVKEWEAALIAMKLRPTLVELRNVEEIDSIFETLKREGANALLVAASSTIRAHRSRIAEHAISARLPTMCPQAWFAEAGCLTSYGPHFPDNFRRAAGYVDKILKGAKPGELPIEQPTKFELVVNLKSANALKLTIPQSILLRADRIIE